MIAMNIQMLSFTTGMAFGTAATTLVGQCLGRIRADLAKIYVKITQNLSMIVSIVVSILMFFGGEVISSLYSEDIGIIKLAADMLKIMAVVNPVSNARFVFVSALRGAGDSRFAAVITFVGTILIRPAVSLLLIMQELPFRMGLTGIWLGMGLDAVVCYLLARARYRRGKWSEIKI
jgi:Na+-driven multidrug efflux pump